MEVNEGRLARLVRTGEFQHHLVWMLPWMLALPVVVFWRPGFFFIEDDWTALIQMLQGTFWNYLNQTDAEQWFPTFHFVYFIMIKAFGDNYGLLLLVNCLATGINTCLVFLFLRRHWPDWISLVFSLLYGAACVHTASAWHAYNVCYILCFGFFMGALLLTDRYLRVPSLLLLAGIGLCEWLAITSHSFAIMTISAIPLYGLLMGGERGRGIFLRLACVTALVYVLFALGYLTFAGARAASSQNHEILSGLPGFGYLLYWFYGSYLYPACHLFGGGLSRPATFIVGIFFLGVSLSVIFLRGQPREKRLAVWALLLNALPFLLVGMARYKMGVDQAGGHRYGIFTLVGAMLILVTAGRILAGSPRPRFLNRTLLLFCIGFLFAGQFIGIHLKQAAYRRMSGAALGCYQELDSKMSPTGSAGEGDITFCPKAHPFLTRSQAMAIRSLLRDGTISP